MIYKIDGNPIQAIQNFDARARVIANIKKAGGGKPYHPNRTVSSGVYIRQGNTSISEGRDGVRRYYEASRSNGAGTLVHEERI